MFKIFNEWSWCVILFSLDIILTACFCLLCNVFKFVWISNSPADISKVQVTMNKSVALKPDSHL